MCKNFIYRAPFHVTVSISYKEKKKSFLEKKNENQPWSSMTLLQSLTDWQTEENGLI